MQPRKMMSVSAILKLPRSKKTHSWLCLFVAVFVAMPMPLVSIEPEKRSSGDATERFPCENSPCGCRSAQHCWTKCCCRTPKQRAEWAKANKVAPPSYAIVTEEAPALVANTASCCSKQTAKPVVKSCCPATSVGGKSDSAKASSIVLKKSSPRVSLQLTLHALVLKCHGQSTDFALMPWTTLVKPMMLGISLPSIDTLGLPAPQQPFSVYYDPAVPPPRRAS